MEVTREEPGSRGAYRPRVADSELVARLGSSGAVVIEGPRGCGKTRTARQVAASEVLLDVDDNARDAVAVAPGVVLQGAVPRLIDEWQVEPRIWTMSAERSMTADSRASSS